MKRWTNLSRSDFIERAYSMALAVALMYAVFVATYRLSLPGLYYDETLYLPPSFLVLGDCGDFAAVSAHWGQCFPVFDQPPYLGALKAYLYAPLVAVFPVSAELVRLPAMILAIVTAILSYRFFAPRLGRPFGILVGVLLLTSPVYLWHARIDWGTFVIGATLRFLVLAFVIRWVETGRAVELALAGVCFTLGLYDKLNFVWLLLPLAGAVALVYPREIATAVKIAPYKTGIIAVICSVIGLLFLYYRIIPSLALELYPSDQTLWQNAARVTNLLRRTFSGAAQAEWMFKIDGPMVSFLSRVFFLQLAVGSITAVVSLLMYKRIAKSPSSWAQVKLFVFLHIVVVGCVITLLTSTNAVGSHHAVFLLPLMAYQAAALMRVLVILGDDWAPDYAAVFAGLSLILAGVVIGEQLRVGVKYLKLLQPEADAYRFYFTPEIYQLARYAESFDADKRIISVDWGTHTQLVSLAPRGHRQRYGDYWPFFATNDPNAKPFNPVLWLVPPGKTMIFVSRPQGNGHTVMAGALANFRAALDKLPGCMQVEPDNSPARFESYLVISVKNNCH